MYIQVSEILLLMPIKSWSSNILKKCLNMQKPDLKKVVSLNRIKPIEMASR